MRALLSTLACFLLVSLPTPALAGEDRVFGEGLSLTTATPLGELIADPESHAGQLLRVDGVVTEICREHGDWLKLSAPRGGSGLLVEFSGSAVALPVDCGGRRVSVEGLLEAVSATEPHADDADGKRVCSAMTRGSTRYRLLATGAVLYGR